MEHAIPTKAESKGRQKSPQSAVALPIVVAVPIQATSEAKPGRRGRVIAAKSLAKSQRPATTKAKKPKVTAATKTKQPRVIAAQQELASFLDSLSTEGQVPPHLVPVQFVGRMFLAADGFPYRGGRSLKRELQREVQGELVRLREDREQLRAMEGCYMGFYSPSVMAEKCRQYLEDLEYLTATEIQHGK